MKGYRIVTGPEGIQGTPEWLKFREGKISASIAPAIMNESPFLTRKQLWDHIVHGTKTFQNDAMKRGNWLEESAREWVNNKLGTNYQPIVVQSVAHSDFIASLDGYFEGFDGEPFILEIKCAGVKDHLEAISGHVPAKYKAQLNHQMDLVGVDSMHYCSFDGEDGVILEVKRDEYYCVDLFAEELSFLASLLNFKPPVAVDKDWVVEANLDLIKMAREYEETSITIAELSEKLERLKADLIGSCGHPKTVIGNLKINQVKGRITTDYSKFVKDNYFVVPDSYTKESAPSWRITTT